MHGLKEVSMSEKCKEGINRNQQQFFPSSLDEYVDESNQVRAIDLYVEQLDLKELGFDDTSTSFEGQKCVDDNIKTLVPAIRTGQELINKG